jgi:signal peptidase
MVRKASKALGVFCTVLMVLFFVVFIAWFTVPRFLGWKPQVVLSGSMEPVLKTGGVAFVAQTPAADVEVGDILTFQHPDKPSTLITHRVTSIDDASEKRVFKTKGDANNDEDNWSVPAENVVGTVQWSVPYIGYVTNRVRTREGFLLIVGLPAAFIVLGEIQSIAREVRKSRRQEEEAAL